MGGAIGPGDWVECIRTRNPGSPNLGRLFLCESIEAIPICDYGHGECAALWFSNDGPQPAQGWAGCTFRPIYRPKTELIESLLRKAHEPLLEPA